MDKYGGDYFRSSSINVLSGAQNLIGLHYFRSTDYAIALKLRNT